MASFLGFFLKLLLSVLLPIMSMDEVSTCNYLETAKNHVVANVAVAKREVVGSRGESLGFKSVLARQMKKKWMAEAIISDLCSASIVRLKAGAIGAASSGRGGGVKRCSSDTAH